MKDFGTKTHFFSKKKWEKVRFRAILRKNIVILQSNQNIRSMKADLIIGRDKEKAELQRCIDSDRSELVIVYGRRRVGKTYLVDEFFGRK